VKEKVRQQEEQEVIAKDDDESLFEMTGSWEVPEYKLYPGF
jgi:hypothetical protein